MSKSELRQVLKNQRMRLTDAERTVKSREIVENLKSLTDWRSVKTVHCFEPIRQQMEPDISGFMTYLEDIGVEVFVPRKIGADWEMISTQTEAPPEQFDVVIVPMLGFDESLHRLGYGGGYYDKFLATQPSSTKVGVSFELGKADALPVENHDIALDNIVTDKKVY